MTFAMEILSRKGASHFLTLSTATLPWATEEW